MKDSTLDLNLLRSVVYPREPLEPGDDERADGDPAYGHTDQDDHAFTYSLYPHLGDHVAGGVVREGYQLNIPLRFAKAENDAAVATAPLLTVGAESVIVDTVKAAEDGSGRLVFRLYESAGARVITVLSFGGTVSEAREVRRALSLCARPCAR